MFGNLHDNVAATHEHLAEVKQSISADRMTDKLHRQELEAHSFLEICLKQ